MSRDVVKSNSKKEGANLLKLGEVKRRAVLGDAHVDKAMASAHSFSLPMQEMVTKYCWGDVWNGSELSDKVRSLINLGMLTALGQSHELAVHVKGAVNNGCTPEEIRAVILQATIYAGAPAGLSAMRVVQDNLILLGEI